MIKIEVLRDGDRIVSISSKGHAGYAERGEDLVCAGVSTVLFGLMNALDELSKQITLEKKKNSLYIRSDIDDQAINAYLRCGYIQLKTIEEVYPEYIQIEERSSK